MKLKKGIACMMAGALVLVSLFQGTPAQAAKKKVAISKKTAVLYTGKTLKLKVKNTKKKVKWSSSNKKIATVSSKGLVKAKKKGKVTITARVAKKRYTCKITVKEKKAAKPTKKPKATPTTKPNQIVSPSPTNSGGTNDDNEVTPSPSPSNGNGGNTSIPSPSPSNGNGGNTSITSPSPSSGNGGNTSITSPSPSSGNGGNTSIPSPSPSNGNGGNTSTPSPSPSGGNTSTPSPGTSDGNSGGIGDTVTPSPSAGNSGGTGDTVTPSPSAGTSGGGGNSGGSDIKGPDLHPSTMLDNLSIGMAKTAVTEKYGTPVKEGKSPLGFDTYAYYNSQYKYFILVSFEGDNVVSFFGIGKDVAYKTAVDSGTTASGLTGWDPYNWFKATSGKTKVGDATYTNKVGEENIIAFTDYYSDSKVFAIQISSYSAKDMSEPDSKLKLNYDGNVVQDMENEIFCMINVYRVMHGFDMFERNSAMDSVAKEESESMKDSGTINVMGRENKEIINAMVAKGINPDLYAESVFYGSVDSIGFFASAMLMKESQAALAKYEVIGVGCACNGSGSSSKTYMTLDFGLGLD